MERRKPLFEVMLSLSKHAILPIRTEAVGDSELLGTKQLHLQFYANDTSSLWQKPPSMPDAEGRRVDHRVSVQ